MTSGNEEMMQQLLKTFVDETSQILNRLDDAVEQNDAKTMHAMLHKIAPSFAYVDQTQLYELAVALEGATHEMTSAPDDIIASTKDFMREATILVNEIKVQYKIDLE